MPERLLLISVILLYFACALIGFFSAKSKVAKLSPLLTHFFSISIVLESLILVFRAMAISGNPLTSLFDSMLVLTIVFGLIYLIFSMFIRQVWFGSVMSGLVFGMIIFTAAVAQPTTVGIANIAAPWTISHVISMSIGEAMIFVAAASSYLYLMADYRLKHKKLDKVMTLIGNLEKTQTVIWIGMLTAFISITFGLVSGVGMALINVANGKGAGPAVFFLEIDIILLILAWGLCAAGSLGRRLFQFKNRLKAYIALTAFALIVMAICTSIFSTQHDFVTSVVK
jgi:hypothetical protein